MRTLRNLLLVVGVLAAAPFAAAQPPEDDRRPPGPGGADDLVARMMEFDANKDGKLTKAEVTDERLHRLFDRADANKDKTVTKAELSALAAQEQGNERGGRRGGPGGPGGGRGGPGGPGGGRGGPGMGPPPRPGEVLPQMMRRRLNLNAKQEKQLAELQKDVDAKLAKILTADQLREFEEMRDRGPGGFGPPGGGPPGERGGPPPGRGGPPPPPRDEPQ